MGGWGQGEGAHTQGSATHSRVLGQALPEMPGPQAPAGPVLDAAPRVVERRVEMPAAAAFAGGAPAAWAEAGGRAFRPSLALSDRSASSLNKLWASQGNGVCCNGGGGGGSWQKQHLVPFMILASKGPLPPGARDLLQQKLCN